MSPYVVVRLPLKYGAIKAESMKEARIIKDLCGCAKMEAGIIARPELIKIIKRIRPSGDVLELIDKPKGGTQDDWNNEID